jgi:hypothetical protein
VNVIRQIQEDRRYLRTTDNLWLGFIPESKRFMDYYRMDPIQRFYFWLRVPLAYWRYLKAGMNYKKSSF